MKPSLETELRYGAPGSLIPGSVLVRAYCAVCAEPIRVTRGTNVYFAECDDCHGALPRKIINQQRACRTQTRGPVRSFPRSHVPTEFPR